jgi:hypothetical protein
MKTKIFLLSFILLITNLVYGQLISIHIIPINPILPQNTVYKLKAIGVYADGHSENITGTSLWTSSNATIVQAYSAGQAYPFGIGVASGGEIITGTSDGTATITATIGSVSGNTLVTVSSDIDSDGVLNNLDNCIFTYNPTQVDNDSDAIGDTCDCLPSFPIPGNPYAHDIKIYAFPGNTIAPSQTVTFYAIVSNTYFNDSTSPGTFQWTKNDIVVGTNSSTYIDASLATGDIVKCTLSAASDSFCVLDGTQTSNPIVFTVGVLNTNESDFNEESVGVYPNPTQNFLTIQSLSTIHCIEIFDLNGRILQTYTQNSHVVNLNTEDFPAGMYFLNVTTEVGINRQKIIKY